MGQSRSRLRLVGTFHVEQLRLLSCNFTINISQPVRIIQQPEPAPRKQEGSVLDVHDGSTWNTWRQIGALTDAPVFHVERFQLNPQVTDVPRETSCIRHVILLTFRDSEADWRGSLLLQTKRVALEKRLPR